MARFPPQKNIHNDVEMDAFMNQLFEEVINRTIIRVKKELQKIIQVDVYDAGDPKVYDRQYKDGGLYDAWFTSGVKSTGGVVESKLEYAPDTMKNDPDNFIHGSNHWENGTDIRDILADIIINGRFDGSPHVGSYFDYTIRPDEGIPWWCLPRDFWTPFIELLEGGEVEDIIEEELRSFGIEFRRF